MVTVQEVITELMEEYTSAYAGSDDTGGEIQHEEEFEDPVVASLTTTSTWIHITAALFFSLIGLPGNGMTIYVFNTRLELEAGKFYPTVLAIVDVMALCILLPLYPFLGYLPLTLLRLFFACFESVTYSYIWIILAMTIERFLAVFKPFTIQTTGRRLRRIVLGLAGLTVSVRFLGVLWPEVTDMMNKFVFPPLFVLTVLAIVTAYPAIVYMISRSSIFK